MTKGTDDPSKVTVEPVEEESKDDPEYTYSYEEPGEGSSDSTILNQPMPSNVWKLQRQPKTGGSRESGLGTPGDSGRRNWTGSQRGIQGIVPQTGT